MKIHMYIVGRDATQHDATRRLSLPWKYILETQFNLSTNIDAILLGYREMNQRHEISGRYLSILNFFLCKMKTCVMK